MSSPISQGYVAVESKHRRPQLQYQNLYPNQVHDQGGLSANDRIYKYTVDGIEMDTVGPDTVEDDYAVDHKAPTQNSSTSTNATVTPADPGYCPRDSAVPDTQSHAQPLTEHNVEAFNARHGLSVVDPHTKHAWWSDWDLVTNPNVGTISPNKRRSEASYRTTTSSAVSSYIAPPDQTADMDVCYTGGIFSELAASPCVQMDLVID